MSYDLGYIDLEERTLQPLEEASGQATTRVSAFDIGPGRDSDLNLKARLKTLERHQLPVFKEPFRLVVSHAGEPLDLAKATCTRTRWPNGHLMEIVNLNGGDYGLSEEQLESFIQTFPVERRP